MRYLDGTVRGSWSPLANDLLGRPIWKSEFCKHLIERSEAFGFSPSGSDPEYATDQVWLSDALGHEEAQYIRGHIHHACSEVIYDHWSSAAEFHQMLNPFIVRFKEGHTESLKLHNDWAEFSMWIRLSAGNEGGDLIFPRQGFITTQIPIGTMLLWPGHNTHPHYTSPITKGVKYAVNFWAYDPVTMIVPEAAK